MSPTIVRFGVTLPGSGRLAGDEALRELALDAERIGFDSIWVADHVALPVQTTSRYPYNDTGDVPWDEGEPWLAPLITLSWLGAVTSVIRLGVSIFVLPLRDPILVAKDIATLNVLTRGRVVLGVGAGWLREEFAILGRSFGDRVTRTEESIRVMRTCWTSEPVELEGTPTFSMMPKPVVPPIWGGGSSDRALRLVATACDGWHPSNLSPAEWGGRADQLYRILEEVGRPREEVTMTVRPGRNRTITAADARAYASAGADVIVADLEYRAISNVADAKRQLERLASSLEMV